jgi:hypothetical protein
MGFTENGLEPKSVKALLVWNVMDCRKGLWAEIDPQITLISQIINKPLMFE